MSEKNREKAMQVAAEIYAAIHDAGEEGVSITEKHRAAILDGWVDRIEDLLDGKDEESAVLRRQVEELKQALRDIFERSHIAGGEDALHCQHCHWILGRADEALALSPTPAPEVGWWCPTCQCSPHPSAVTYEERHDLCGTPVGAIPSPALKAPEPVGWRIVWVAPFPTRSQEFTGDPERARMVSENCAKHGVTVEPVYTHPALSRAEREVVEAVGLMHERSDRADGGPGPVLDDEKFFDSCVRVLEEWECLLALQGRRSGEGERDG